MENKKSIKAYLFIIIALATGLIFGFSFGKSNSERDLELLNHNLESSINQIESKNWLIYGELENFFSNPVKVDEWFSRAKKFRHETDTIYNFIQEIKQRKKNQITVEEIETLQSLLDAHIDFLQNNLVYSFRVYNNGQEKSRWISYDNVKQLSKLSPKAFIVALSKIQVDIKNNETEVLQYMRNRVDARDFRVNRMEAIAIPNSNYIRLGETYSARIVFAAADTTRPIEVYIDGKQIVNGIYEIKPTSTGTFTYRGEMTFFRPDALIVFPFESSYIVGK